MGIAILTLNANLKFFFIKLRLHKCVMFTKSGCDFHHDHHHDSINIILLTIINTMIIITLSTHNRCVATRGDRSRCTLPRLPPPPPLLHPPPNPARREEKARKSLMIFWKLINQYLYLGTCAFSYQGKCATSRGKWS